MKKITQYLLFLLVFSCFTSCISSEFVGVESNFLTNDASLEGSWTYAPQPEDGKDDLDLIPAKLIIKKGTKAGEYVLEAVKKEKEGVEKQPNAKLSLFVGKIKNTQVFCFGGTNKKEKKQFFNGAYSVSGGVLKIRLMLEKGAIKEGKIDNDVKPTTFSTAKEIQNFVSKNIGSDEYLSKEIQFKKD